MENEFEGTEIKNASEVEGKQPRLVLAILMAAVMGLIGSALYILLYYIGIIAWVAGFVLVLAAAWGYKKFNLKLDTKGYIIVAVISVIEILISLFVGLAIDCAEIFEVPFGESFGLLMELINDYPDLKSAVISDAIFSVVSIVVGFVLLVSTERRKAKMLKKEEELAKQAETENAEKQETGEVAVSETTTETVEEDSDKDDDDDKTEAGMEY